MDFWSRLIGGIGAPSPKSKPNPNSPQQRSAQFKRIYEQLVVWRKNSISSDPSAAETARISIANLRQILQDEIQSPAPHLCIQNVATFQIYDAVTRVASLFYNEPILQETLDFLNLLVESEEGGFVEVTSFADSLITFISNLSTSGPLMVNVEIESNMVELLFGVAAKLRTQEELLPVWFRPAKPEEDITVAKRGQSGSKSKLQHKEFPLFYILLDYVHHEGRVGDFARTGLLYVIESAARSEALEKWIIESDLATLMASGLGALYSQLSRKLTVSFSKDAVPTIVTFSGEPRTEPTTDAEETSSPEFQAHLATFLSHLVFWQDTLEHCSSGDVKNTLLDHYQFLFLRQLLYPSLLESSDVDGGSSVAVLTYLTCVLESINHPDLIRITLQYLLAVPEAHPKETPILRPSALARRRQSETLISNLVKGEDKPSPDLFNLVDLILVSLRSQNQDTVTATLRLISVMLRSQHQYAVSGLIRVNYNVKETTRTIRTVNQETEHLLSMAEDLIDDADVDNVYEDHLDDARTLIENHACSALLLALPGSEAEESAVSGLLKMHTIAHGDPLLAGLLSSFEHFFVNNVETNLTLTQTFSTLVSCGYTQLRGWLLPTEYADASHVVHDATQDSESEEPKNTQAPIAQGMDLASNTQISDTSGSPMFDILNSLVVQIQRLRQDIQDFDIHLAERKHIFRVGSEIDNAITEDAGPLRTSFESQKTPSKARSGPQMGSISQRLMPDATSTSTSPSRPSTPRGRQQVQPSTPTLVEHLSHLQLSPSRTPGKRVSREYSPSPLGRESVSSTPPKPIPPPKGGSGALQQKIKMKYNPIYGRASKENLGSDSGSVRSGSTEQDAETLVDFKEISLSHVLTNVIILQEFILELAALIQVRASLFDEVTFD